MRLIPSNISPREALAAPIQPHEIHWQSVVILVVSVLSMLGAAWIMASFAAFSSLRCFRHQLILGLAVSDFVMALNFFLSSTMNVSGHLIGDPAQEGFCSFNGFMTQVFVIQTDYWVLTIALCTFFILAQWKRAGAWVQDHRRILWSLPWFFSVLWASIGLGTAGYGDIGAWCWFTSDQVRLLVNFVPRWTIVAFIFIIYLRVFLILYKAQRRFITFDEEAHRDGIPNDGDALAAPTPKIHKTDDSLGDNTTSGNNKNGGIRQNRKFKKLARLMLIYPLAYAIIWLLPTTIRIYQTVSSHRAPWQLQTVDKACIVIQGFVDALIYGLNETSLSSWRHLLFPRDSPAVPDHGKGGSPSSLSSSASPSQSRNPTKADLRRSGGAMWPLSSSSGVHRGGTSATTASASDSSHSLDLGPTDTNAEVGILDVRGFGDVGPHDGTVPLEMGRIRKTVEVEIRTSIHAAGSDAEDSAGRSFYRY